MKQTHGSGRYLATAVLRQQIVDQGRRADWLAQRAGFSKSFLSKVVSQQKTIAESDARVISALLHAEFGLLFELSESASLALVDGRAAA